MFKEKYKQTYDKIQGDKTQIAKIIALANNTVSTEKHKPLFSFRFGTVFAAVLVICVSVYSFPQLRDSTKPMDENVGISNEAKDFVPDENVSFQPSDSKDDVSVPEKDVSDVVADAEVEKGVNTAEKTVSPVVESRSGSSDKGVASTVKKSDGNATSNKESEIVANENATPESASEQETALNVAMESDEELAQTPVAASETDNEEECVVAAAEPSAGFSMAAGATGRSMPLPGIAQHTKQFEDGSYATVTVYSENEQIEEIFATSESTSVGNTETVVVDNGELQKVYIKAEEFYAEIDAYNITDENLKTTIEEVDEIY